MEQEQDWRGCNGARAGLKRSICLRDGIIYTWQISIFLSFQFVSLEVETFKPTTLEPAASVHS